MSSLLYFFLFSTRNWASANLSIENGTWVHLAVVIQRYHPAVSMYINGNQKYQSNRSVSITTSELSTALDDAFIQQNIASGRFSYTFRTFSPQRFQLDIYGHSILYFPGMSISGYQVVPRRMLSDEVLKFANTCHSKSTQAIVTMDDFISKPSKGIDVITPSQCDSEYRNKHHWYFD